MTSEECNVCECLGWDYYEDGAIVELSQESPAGEDFSFTVTADDFVRNVQKYAADFNPEEHAAMWYEAGKNGVRNVPGLRVLMQDADDIAEMLDELAEKLLLNSMGIPVCSIRHDFDPETGRQAWTLIKNCSCCDTELDAGDGNFYGIAYKGRDERDGTVCIGTKGGDKFVSVVIQDNLIGTRAKQWEKGGDIYEYFLAHKFRVYPTNDPGSFILWDSPDSVVANSASGTGFVCWNSDWVSPRVASGRRLEDVVKAVNTAWNSGKPVTFEVY